MDPLLSSLNHPQTYAAFAFGRPDHWMYERNLTAFLPELTTVETSYPETAVPFLTIDLPTGLLERLHHYSKDICQVMMNMGLAKDMADWEFTVGYDVFEEIDEELKSVGFGKGIEFENII